MMSASTDVESQSVARSRGRCLDTFLTVSVIALFVMFLAAIGGALLFVRHIEREINERTRRETDGRVDALHGPVPSAGPGSSYKAQNFAYLGATESELESGVMKWKPIDYSESKSIGSLYSYDEIQNVLSVKSSGSYFLYVQLTFSCVHICKSAHFTVNVSDQVNNKLLTCSMSLGNSSATHPVTQTCWHVVTLSSKESRLLAKIELPQKLENWKLELNESGLGMFLVDR